jgi:hypothetical protein
VTHGLESGYHDRAARVTGGANLSSVEPKAGPKRRLPVLNSPSAEEPEDRRPWQWVGFGALAVFTVWIPLSGLAGWMASHLAASAEPGDGARVARTGIAIAVLYLGMLALGAGLGGFLVGRWGTRGVGVREAALAGWAAAAAALVVTWVSLGFSTSSLLLVAVAPPMAAWGGKMGLRGRVM